MSFDSSNLPEKLCEGLNALRNKKHAEIKVINTQGNFCYIHLGVIELPDVYEQEETNLFARVPNNFPNALPYGVLTDTFLKRKDGKTIERYHKNHSHAKPIEEFSKSSSTGFFSWNWKGLPSDTPSDLIYVYDWALTRVMEEA